MGGKRVSYLQGDLDPYAGRRIGLQMRNTIFTISLLLWKRSDVFGLKRSRLPALYFLNVEQWDVWLSNLRQNSSNLDQSSLNVPCKLIFTCSDQDRLATTHKPLDLALKKNYELKILKLWCNVITRINTYTHESLHEISWTQFILIVGYISSEELNFRRRYPFQIIQKWNSSHYMI